VAEVFVNELGTQPSLQATGIDEADSRKAPVYAIVDPRLGSNIDRPQYLDDDKDYLGGVAIVLEGISPPPTRSQLVSRLQQMREQQMYSDTLARHREVRVLEGDDSAVRSAAILIRDENIGFFGNQDAWKIDLAQREWSLARDALLKPATLAGVQNFSPAIASTFKAQAVVALSLSFLLIGIYIWVRFGSVRYSLGAIACLFHDVLTAVGLIALAQILYDYPPTQGICQRLGILPFKIDLNMVAALMTVAGYSLNDTIIIMDRIRENRGKANYASRETINNAINQTISRTLITSGTTIISLLVLYLWGGEGVRGFSYAMLIGIVVGTYSSWAVAAPLVWSRKHHEEITRTGGSGGRS
jgi:SecD/SecF fusion protein